MVSKRIFFHSWLLAVRWQRGCAKCTELWFAQRELTATGLATVCRTFMGLSQYKLSLPSVDTAPLKSLPSVATVLLLGVLLRRGSSSLFLYLLQTTQENVLSYPGGLT